VENDSTAEAVIRNHKESVQTYHGDCLEVMTRLPEKSIDLICCDLPYGVTRNKWDTVIDLQCLWKQYQRLLKPKGTIVLTATQPFSSALVMSNPKWFKHEWIWDKVFGRGFLSARFRPLQQHEHVLVFGQSITYHPQMVKLDKPRLDRWTGKTNCYGTTNADNSVHLKTHGFPKSIIQYNNASNKGRTHPTEKPVALLEYLVHTYSDEGATVMDNCMGTGSCGVAAINTGRLFVGIEMDEEYYRAATARLNARLLENAA
jgi:site-specific DNA-methyltransferase (adenine-specific)